MRSKASWIKGFGFLVVLLTSWWCLSVGISSAEEDVAAISARGDVAYSRGDIVDALQWYQKAAGMGDSYAQARLGYIYDMAEENEQAVIWYRKAAEQGDPVGQHGLAQMYLNGEGVTRDVEQALALMKKAAEQDNLPSIVLLARTYEKGLEEVEVDLPLSLGYWRQAAGLGEQQAVLRMANAYRKGELGLDVDEAEAAKWQKRLGGAESTATN
ncbi:MAG: sel1 repeat family protein [Betaproteobacteria bacterium]|nr:MAG: sel1 repeat family protein [Betaproteobacteria bacterium]